MYTINFGFVSTELSFVFKSATFGPLLHFLGPFGLSFLGFGAFFGVGVRFKNIFGTYLCRQSTLVLKVQPYLLVFNFAAYWASFALFLGSLGLSYGPLGLFYGPSRLLFGAVSGSKAIFGTYQ